jgi:hypothetical protein
MKRLTANLKKSKCDVTAIYRQRSTVVSFPGFAAKRLDKSNCVQKKVDRGSQELSIGVKINEIRMKSEK